MKKFLIGCALVLVLVMIGTGWAMAEVAPADPQTLASVKANCNQIKTRLRQLRVNDALLRVNYGQVYESISANVIAPVNTRLITNGLKPVELIAISSDYDKNLAQFRKTYLSYEEKLSDLLSQDCNTHPAEFYRVLNEVRNLRQRSGELLRQVDGLAHQYQNKLWELSNDF